MADDKPQVGSIGWHDLTVENAEQVRDFYEQVVGWTSSPVDMKGYSDFNMVTPSGQAVAGVCHARGSNADLPPQWLLYFVVEDVGKSASTCEEQGGRVLIAPRPLAGGRFCVIKDPAGAVCALYQP
jgi:predicted enzyme related to lactoylglutathione lyase